MGLFDSALATGFKLTLRTAGATLTLRRGTQTGTLVGVPGRITLKQQSDFEQLNLVSGERTYRVFTADYKLNGIQTDPLPGDLIDEVVNGTPKRFRVARMSNDRVFEYADPSHLILLVRCIEARFDN